MKNKTKRKEKTKMKNKEMLAQKIERLCWTAALIALAVICWFIHRDSRVKSDNYSFLVDTAAAERQIMLADLTNMNTKINEAESTGFTRGYADGAANMGASLVSDKRSFVNYSDGYHAAVRQFGYQLEDLTPECAQIKCQFGKFEELLGKQDFDNAALELSDIIARLETRLEDVFMESIKKDKKEESIPEAPTPPEVNLNNSEKDLLEQLEADAKAFKSGESDQEKSF